MILIKNRRKLALLGLDLCILAVVYILTLTVGLMSYSLQNADHEFWVYLVNFLLFAVCIFCARFAFSIYSNVVRYANSLVFIKMVAADAIGGVVAVVVSYLITPIYIGFWMGCAYVCMANVLTLVSRFAYQQFYRSKNITAQKKTEKIPVAIVGAGQIGSMLAEELIYDKRSKYIPVCFIDKNKQKIGGIIQGIKVYPDDQSSLDVLDALGVREVLIAISNIDEEHTEAYFEYYGKSGRQVKIYDFPLKPDGASDKEARRVIREVRIEDLLFRTPLSVVNADTSDYYKGKTVLVTGGGGSIGSELCRQIASFSPKKLIILDIYENNAYDIQQELSRKYGENLDLAVEIASVRDRARLEAVFSCYRPDVVFHAAAHKHVPLMEHSNCEAIKNNVMGTYNTADMAEKYGVGKFILISTDKAVNPTNVMGASKRLCEMVIQCRKDSATAFAAVRFGNVLGSNGSVIPLFSNQIANGGPVTVTDKRIIRYFMTIPEASGLVLQAGAMAKCGELFVLDMGKPVKIMDLAENMIKLSGLVPYIDIDIIETGLRPGEKLYEELLIKTEKLDKTENNMIFIEKDTPLSRAEVDEKLELLRRVVKEEEGKIASSEITLAMKSVVPTFRSPEEVNINAGKAAEMKMANA